MTILLILGIIILLICGGALLSGAFMFKELFTRKPDDGAYNIESMKEALEKMKQDTPGSEIQGVKMPARVEAFSAHVNDKKIMVPILEAKIRWLSLLENGKIQQLKIIAHDGITLSGYLLNNETSEKVALLVHGYTDSGAGMAYLAEEYQNMGFSVLTVDCRGHGQSEGKNITMGYTDAIDVAQWVEEIMKLKGDKTKIVLHGVSMGAVSVIRSLNQQRIIQVADNILGVAADCGFSSAIDQLSQQGKILFGDSLFMKLGTRWMLAGLSTVNWMRCGFFYFQDSAKIALIQRRTLPTAKIPLVLFHGEKDAFISPQMAHQLEEAAGDTGVTVVHVPHAPHIGSYFYDRERYMDSIRKTIRA